MSEFTSDAARESWEQFLAPRIAAVAADRMDGANIRRAAELARLLPAPIQGSAAVSIVSWWSRVRTAVATLVEDQSILAGAALRGDSIRSMGYRHDETRVDLEIEPVRRSTKHQGIIRGQVEAPADCNGIPVAFVAKSGVETASTTLDDLGFFSAMLPSGTYDIAIAMPGGPICVAEVLVQ